MPLFRRLRQPVLVWWALLVALVGALAVPLAHAGGAARGAGVMEICTSTGTQTLATDSGHGPESIPYLAHCPFCLHPTDRLAPHPSRLTHFSTVSGGMPAPAFRQALFFALHAAAVPPPRGPPLVS